MAPPDDHFTPIAAEYARGRIGYPRELFQFLAGLCPQHELAWDCATGNGQAARSLAEFFEKVIATDLSPALLAQAPPHPKIEYRCVAAEHSTLAPATVDLLTVAQAIHWFDLPQFWHEAQRTLRPRGVLAFWGYTWPAVSRDVDRSLEELKTHLAAHWPAKSALLHRNYQDISAPFEEIACPSFAMSVRWTRDDYLNHLRSWSALRYRRQADPSDPLRDLENTLQSLWPDDASHVVTWQLHLRAYCVA